jgi:hypothetical protein|tara:strand:- start:334 stop:1242 length:909 start_codon:yes stop_codon:yes gene_type:complete
MATSGSVDFNLDMADITEEAFERCGLEFRTGYDSRTARKSLNLLFADWANRGLNLWTIDQVTQSVAQLSSTSAVTTYPVGVITATVGDSSSLSVGETITGGSSGVTASIITKPSSTTLTLTVPSGSFTAAETITGSSSSASTTISADPSLADVQASGDVLEAVLRRSSEDISITRISRQEYLSIPKKTTQGRPTQFYVDRQITPTITVWPAPENSTDSIIYYRVKRIQDADAATNTADVPYRFLPCLVAGLAFQIALKRSPQRIEILKALYEEEFQRASSEDIFGAPTVSLRLIPTSQSLRI